MQEINGYRSGDGGSLLQVVDGELSYGASVTDDAMVSTGYCAELTSDQKLMAPGQVFSAKCVLWPCFWDLFVLPARHLAIHTLRGASFLAIPLTVC